MINFNYETDFNLDNEDVVAAWLGKVITSENKKEGDINYVFCDDEYLHKINVEYLDHDTLTDIISFDYSMGNELHGDIFVSIERVKDNALDYNVSFKDDNQQFKTLHLLTVEDDLGDEYNFEPSSNFELSLSERN